MLMENFLRSKEYWIVVEVGVSEPMVGADAAQRAKIEKEKLKDLKAKNYLFQAIDQSILETILNKFTSKTIWDSMKKKYQGNERAKRQQCQALPAKFERAVGRGKGNWKDGSRSGKPRSDRLEKSSATGNQKRWQNRNYQVANNRSKSVRMANIECFKCHKYGHYRFECHANLNRGESSNFVEHNEKNDDSSLFMVCHPKEVSKKNVWYLDTGCSNHMCGDKSAFSDLDESFQDKVKFADNFTIVVKGRGKEKGYEILIKDGVCQVLDSKLGLIAKVKMTGNSKQHRDSFPKDRSWRAKRVLDLVHSDLCGTIYPTSNGDFENGEDLTVQNSKGQTQQTGGLTSADLEVSRLTTKESLHAEVKLSTGESLLIIPELESGTSSRPQLKKRRPAWLEDYEVTNLPQDDVLVTHFALFANCDPLTYKEALKKKSGKKPWPKKLVLLKGTRLGIARMDTIRLVIALAAQNSWSKNQLDVKSAFFHGNLQEQVFIDSPPGYVKFGFEHKVYRLKKALYRLKQAPKAWYSRIDAYFLKEGFQKCPYKHTLYIKFGDGGSGVVSWSSKKQPIVTLSTTEVKYVAATSCACQAIWLRRVLEELEMNQHEATSIYCDNSLAIKLSRNPVLHGRSKHIHVRIQFEEGSTDSRLQTWCFPNFVKLKSEDFQFKGRIVGK
ncbi:hypothetical protein SLEP1_g56878 [Rubroshorea leprosula]|uniref:CCHC-type domain-containing protein n=1 Tax=Rubroshorea leprosula TaxID=152421 RepID=A0AAV5MK17_9ROSI|nr:hypothetical protein SLEP1_g56878 [Rubroshorea leprosula]